MSSQRPYHHGDLRRALLEAAERALEQETIEQLSLRRLAKTLGVSVTAPYAHFASKAELLTAVACSGFQRLRHALEAETPRAEASLEQSLTSLGRVYLRFAEAHPGAYRVMFGAGIRVDSDPQLADAAAGAFGELRDGIARSRPSSMSEHEVQPLALIAWSTVHGLAMLTLDARLSSSFGVETDPDTLATLAARYVSGSHDSRTPK